MTAALCYSGFLRTWERCAPNHKEFIYDQNNEVHKYFYTYEFPGEVNVFGRGEMVRYVQCPHPFYDDPFAPHEFDKNKAGETKVHQVYNMMHNRLVGFSLIPKGYDFYVNIRTDMVFNGPLDFSKYEAKPNTIYIPKGMDYRGINDQFAFGDYDTMRKYFSVYLNAWPLHLDGHLFNSEVFHLANLNKYGIEIVRLEEPQHDLVR